VAYPSVALNSAFPPGNSNLLKSYEREQVKWLKYTGCPRKPGIASSIGVFDTDVPSMLTACVDGSVSFIGPNLRNFLGLGGGAENLLENLCLNHAEFEGFTAVTMKTTVLRRGAVWIYYKPTFRRNVSPPSSGL
jgi:hypothetical protein